MTLGHQADLRSYGSAPVDSGHSQGELFDLGLNAEALLNCWRLPDYVKFGVGVVRVAARDLHFRQHLRELIDFGHAHGVQIVAAGIEKTAELDVATDAGIDLGRRFIRRARSSLRCRDCGSGRRVAQSECSVSSQQRRQASRYACGRGGTG